MPVAPELNRPNSAKALQACVEGRKSHIAIISIKNERDLSLGLSGIYCSGMCSHSLTVVVNLKLA